MPDVFISKEIVQRHDMDSIQYDNDVDVGNFAMDVQQHLNNALIKPRSKFSFRHRILPDSRYMEDYLFHPEKYLYGVKYTGFSLNPEHTARLNGKYHSEQAILRHNYAVACMI